jgi:hypothetical protein
MPGVFADFAWVSSPEFWVKEPGEPVREVDPAPLARLIGVLLKLIDGDIGEHIAAIADDDQDGPVHIAHLLGACQFAASKAGGTVPHVPGLIAVLHEGGLKAAVIAIREMDRVRRRGMLDLLLDFWHAPVDGLCDDITDERILLDEEPE